MRVILLLCFMVGLSPSLSMAQAEEQDSLVVQLLEVPVYAQNISSSLVGSKVEYPSAVALDLHQTGQLSDLLRSESNINMKTYGSGMLSTISFRGTTANQTSVHWNNFNINNYTLGLVDFSTLPVSAIDEMVFVAGSGSSFGGNGAIGGTISLSNNYSFAASPKLELRQTIGSFGKSSTAVNYAVSNKNLYSSTRAYYTFSRNDFVVQETNERLENASYFNYGLNQHLGYQLNKHQVIEVSAWYHLNDRQIQPAIRGGDKKATQLDESLRSSVSFKHEHPNFNLYVGTGYFHDKMRYQNGLATSEYVINRSESFIEVGKTGPFNLKWTVYNRLNIISAISEKYINGGVTESRYTYGLRLGGKLLNKLAYSFNLRQQFVSDTKLSPVSPYLGLKVPLYSSSLLSLKLKASSTFNYRVPTLNDRFWEIQDREEIETEKGWNTDATFDLGINSKNSSWLISTSVYKNVVNNLIQWVPRNGISVPVNEECVKIHGLEGEINYYYTGRMPEFKVQAQLNYSYNHSEPYLQNQATNKQLRYVPKHKFTSQLVVSIERLRFAYLSNYTGKVFDTENNSSTYQIPAYLLHDLSVQFSWNSFALSLQINNLFDEQYQTYLNYAMPGRNYEFTINYTLNKLKK